MAGKESISERINCPFELTIELIGGKWKGLILWHLHDKEVLRNGEMMRLIPKITQKMLTQQLREMEEDGLITRRVYTQVPPKVEYSLTPRAKALSPIIEMMQQWGIEYAKEQHITITCKSTI
jgi:DNA-binding HxlR family transcriptional regulator